MITIRLELLPDFLLKLYKSYYIQNYIQNYKIDL
jgi:hypothetical protein